MKKIVIAIAIFLSLASKVKAEIVEAIIVSEINTDMIASHKATPLVWSGALEPNCIWILVIIPSKNNMSARVLVDVNVAFKPVSSGSLKKDDHILIELFSEPVANPKVPALAGKPIKATLAN